MKRLSFKSKMAILGSIAALAVVGPEVANAAVSAGGAAAVDLDGSFAGIWGSVRGLAEGYVGKIGALLVGVIGVFQGIQKQSMWALVISLGIAIGISNLPQIIDSLFTAGGDVDDLINFYLGAGTQVVDSMRLL